MAWLAFTKKAQIRNIALHELKHLFRILETTSGIPTNFWDNPYAVGFVFGYILGVGVFVAGKNAKVTDINNASVDVLFELAPEKAGTIAKRFEVLDRENDSQFNLGQSNGTILALFLNGSNAVEGEHVVLEARRRASEIGAALVALPSGSNLDERGKVAIALRQIVFYDRLQAE